MGFNRIGGLAVVCAYLLLAACSSGDSGDDGYRYHLGVKTVCEQSDGVTGAGDCPRAIDETHVLEPGDTLRLTFPRVAGRITHVESWCPLSTQLHNSAKYRELYRGDVGELHGEALLVEPLRSSCSIEVTYLVQAEVTTDSGLHGSISPTRKRVNSRIQTQFKVTVDDGYVVDRVSGCDDNGSLDGDTYTLRWVNRDCVLSVSYLEIPDMAGIWAGTWEGEDRAFGPVAGTWVLRMTQQNTELVGPIEFAGDLDCAEGEMSGAADPRDASITGTVRRFPSPTDCARTNWYFTAFDDDETSASGVWAKNGISNGAFEGRRIAALDGPRIDYFFPPWADAGDYVTVVGENLDMDPVNDSLTLGTGGTAIVPELVDARTIRLRLPGSATGSERFHLQTFDGAAMSPLSLNTGVTSPDTAYRQHIAIAGSEPLPKAVVFSINNRRGFVVNGGAGSLSMVNTDHGSEFTSTRVLTHSGLPVALHAVAVHPNGRLVYAAGDAVLAIFHAHTLQLLDTLALPADAGGAENPQGIAVSPDGRFLLLSEAIPQGRVTIVDIEDDYVVANTLTMPVGATPRAIAVNPDGRHAYIALSGSSNKIQVYDLHHAATLPAIDLGIEASALSVTPDARFLVVGDAGAARIYRHDLSLDTTATYPLATGSSPNALTITPDGNQVLASNDSDWIDVVDFLSGAATSAWAGGAGSSIGVSRDGRRAYVTQPGHNRVVEFGNQRTLRVGKQGGGIGSIRTIPAAIDCGTECSATFSHNSAVRLYQEAADGFRFVRWGGDPDCSDGYVYMTANRYCIARFEIIQRPSHPGSGGSSGSPPGGQSSCFIATAAYGSALEPRVMSLRMFRDEHLLTNVWGTRFVAIYYRNSPPIADYIRDREWLRVAVRGLLTVLISAIEYPGFALLCLTGLLMLPWHRRIRRQSVLLRSRRRQAALSGGIE